MTIFTTSMFWIFMGVNFVNVLLNTVKSLVTIKGGKWLASITNAICFGFYTVIIVLTATCDLPLITKCFAVAFVNFVGVFSIKFIEEKMQKDRLWIYNATAKVNSKKMENVVALLKNANVKLVYNVVVENELYTLQIFSNDKKESEMITSILDNFSIKYYAIESKEKNGN